MKLTGQAKKDFEEWYLKTHCKTNGKEITKWQRLEVLDWLYGSVDTIKNAFIIEWLDSVGVYIFIDSTNVSDRFTFYVNKKHYETEYNTRQITTKYAIKKANETYNSFI